MIDIFIIIILILIRSKLFTVFIVLEIITGYYLIEPNLEWPG